MQHDTETKDMFERLKKQPKDTVLRLLREHCVLLPEVRAKMDSLQSSLANRDGARFILTLYTANDATMRQWALITPFESEGSMGNPETMLQRFRQSLPPDNGLRTHNVMATLRRVMGSEESKHPQNPLGPLWMTRTLTGYLDGTGIESQYGFLKDYTVIDHWTYYA